ncbi:MAG: hypothetical protein CMF61_03640 [Magnetococcales bacterium]|nr:hypothetical protein [Magnetococcales bacterium]
MSMDFGKTVLLFISVLFVAWWVGAVMKAEGEDKYVEACRPVTLSTKYLMKITTGLTGFTPKWTVTVKKKLDGGCYYFFATFILNEDLGEGTEAGVRMKAREGGISR